MRRDIFQAIADPTRRAIIALIALQAMTPNAIAENFNADSRYPQIKLRNKIKHFNNFNKKEISVSK